MPSLYCIYLILFGWMVLVSIMSFGLNPLSTTSNEETLFRDFWSNCLRNFEAITSEFLKKNLQNMFTIKKIDVKTFHTISCYLSLKSSRMKQIFFIYLSIKLSLKNSYCIQTLLLLDECCYWCRIFWPNYFLRRVTPLGVLNICSHW